MDGNIAWHYLPLSEELYKKALTEIEEELWEKVFSRV